MSVGITLACLMAGLYFISSRVLLRNYENIEQRETARKLQRVGDELSYQLSEMHASSTDWSNWDDSYRFMSDHNKAFVVSNLTELQLNLDLMMFIDSAGRVFQYKQLVRPGHQPPPNPEDLRTALGFDNPATRIPANKDLSGVVALKNGETILTSVRPILRTNGSGAPRGWMVFALRLDRMELGRLAGRMHLNLALYDLDSPASQPSCTEALAVLRAGKPSYTKPLNDQTILGYSFLKDVFGHPVRLLRLNEPRNLYAASLDSQRYLMQFLIAAGIVFSIVIILVFEIAALSRVSKLSLQVERIGLGMSEKDQVSLPGKDELSWLASKIDGMIRSLREGKLELSRKNDDLQATVSRLAAANHILENAVEGIAEFDSNGRLFVFNSAFAEMHGYDSKALAGFHWQTLIAPDDHERIAEAIEHAIEHGKGQCEVQGRKRDGALFHEEVVVVNSLGAGKGGECHWFTKEITERKVLENQIQHQAFHDLLTGLPNRALFVDRLRTACRRANRRKEALAVLFMDLNDFKLVNDTMGHEAGDFVLTGVAARIQHCVRHQDTVARLGGDEFTVLLDGVKNIEEAIEVAERIIEGLETPLPLPNGKVSTGASIGIVFSQDGEHDADTLLHDADIAMYKAKVSKSPYAVFDPSMNAPALERRELAEALRVALDNDGLVLNYQPLVDLNSGRVVGVEALLRWNDSERGDISPSVFIHVAEEAGLIDALGTWALRHACRQMKEWLDFAPLDSDLTISVNLSGKQLQRADLADTVALALADAGLPPERLCIEIAAKLIGKDSDRAGQALRDLKGLGIKLAIDDFGTGSHLITKLGDYPFDRVKIDGTVTWLLETDAEACALAQAMLIMAKSVQVEVAAEGVERYSQLSYLRELGCTLGQGFYFGRPLAADKLLTILASGDAFKVFDEDMSSESAA